MTPAIIEQLRCLFPNDMPWAEAAATAMLEPSSQAGARPVGAVPDAATARTGALGGTGAVAQSPLPKVRDLASMLAARQLSSVELTRHYLDRIDRWESTIHAFTRLDRAEALAQAEACDEAIARGQIRSILHGIPVALKDMIDVEGAPTTFHSALMRDVIASRDAVCVRRLREAGAILFGKLAMHEFALGGPSFDGVFPPSRNPWNPALHPGGSSSGAGAGLAAGFFPLAVGTDSGGSIRGPSAACGITGFKPSYGAISVEGVLPVAPSVDHVGPMAGCVDDVGILFDVLKDPSAPLLARTETSDTACAGELRGLRMGFISEFHQENCDDEIRTAIESFCFHLQQLGCEIRFVGMPQLSVLKAASQIILCYEAWRIYGHRVVSGGQHLSRTTRRRLLVGSALANDAYYRALQIKKDLVDHFDKIFTENEYVFCGNSLQFPCEIEDEAMLEATVTHHARAPFNLAGTPTIALCIGSSASGLPISAQIATRRWNDLALLRSAGTIERHVSARTASY